MVNDFVNALIATEYHLILTVFNRFHYVHLILKPYKTYKPNVAFICLFTKINKDIDTWLRVEVIP